MDGGKPLQDGRVKRMLDYIFGALMGAAIILTIVTVILCVNGTKKRSTYKECNGIITRFYENSTEGALGSYESVSVSPVVEYIVNGARYEFVGKFYSTNMKVGQKITVLYNPNDPSIASIKSGTLFAPIITGVLAVVFLIPAVVYYVIKAKGLI